MLLTVNDVATMLGLSKSTIYRLIKNGCESRNGEVVKLKVMRFTKKGCKVHPDDLDEFLGEMRCQERESPQDCLNAASISMSDMTIDSLRQEQRIEKGRSNF